MRLCGVHLARPPKSERPGFLILFVVVELQRESEETKLNNIPFI